MSRSNQPSSALSLIEPPQALVISGNMIYIAMGVVATKRACPVCAECARFEYKPELTCIFLSSIRQLGPRSVSKTLLHLIASRGTHRLTAPSLSAGDQIERPALPFRELDGRLHDGYRTLWR